jgi:hypothetical protein
MLLPANGLAAEELIKWSSDVETLKKEWSGKVEYQELDGKLCGVVEESSYITSKAFIPVEPGKKYTLSGTFKSLGKKPSKVYYGFKCYDKDKKWISSLHSNVMTGSATVLAADCKKGDKKIVVKANKKWAKNYAVAFNAKDDFSDLPNREIVYKITKVTPLEGGENVEVELSAAVAKDYPAGTKVRTHTSRYGTYIYTTVCGAALPGTWKTYEETAVLGKPGEMSFKHFRPGTAFVVVIMLSNYRKDDDEKMAFTDLTLKVSE